MWREKSSKKELDYQWTSPQLVRTSLTSGPAVNRLYDLAVDWFEVWDGKSGPLRALLGELAFRGYGKPLWEEFGVLLLSVLLGFCGEPS